MNSPSSVKFVVWRNKETWWRFVPQPLTHRAFNFRPIARHWGIGGYYRDLQALVSGSSYFIRRNTRPRHARPTCRIAIVAGSRNPGVGGTNIGNGRVAAVRIAARGAKVLCLDMDCAALAATARLIAAETGACALAEADVAKAPVCAAALAEAARLKGPRRYPGQQCRQ
jgi:hypothetical protein